MLERAARCVSYGGRKFTSSNREPFQTCRMLHSAFWHHGADDLALSPWPIPSLQHLFEPVHLNLSSNVGSTSSPEIVETFLNFLYPAKTKAFIRQLSIQGLRRWHHSKSMVTIENTLRGFMSTAIKKQVAIDQREQTATQALSRKSLNKLVAMIAQHRKDPYQDSGNQAWQLWSAIRADAKTPGLIQGMIHLLSNSSGNLNASRAIQLFRTLPTSDIWPSTFFHIINAHITLDEISNAVLLHESSLKAAGADLDVTGSDLLLAQLIANEDWRLTLYVWDNCHNCPAFKDNKRAAHLWQNQLWTKIAKIPNISQKVVSLIKTLREHPGMNSKTQFSFPERLVLETMRPLKVEWQQEDVNAVIKSLDAMDGMIWPTHFEAACHRTLLNKNLNSKDAKYEALELFNLWRGKVFYKSPRANVLVDFARAFMTSNDLEVLRILLDDWTRFNGPPIGYPLSLFMTGFARLGQVEVVVKLLSDGISANTEIHPGLFQPLLHCHALLGRPEAVRREMEQMRQNYRIEPNLHCWSCLLHAYQRTNDLDGVMECLSKLEEAGLQPNQYIIGTAMAAAADRGDVDQVEQLGKMARFYSIPKSQHMTDTLVLAHLKNENWREAEQIVLQATAEVQNLGDATRMWNQILTYYGSERPPFSISNIKRVSASMDQLKVPFDAFTISSLMRAYKVAGNVFTARKIFHKYLGTNKLPVTSFHYAIILDGLANQQQFEMGFSYHADMLRRGIEPDRSTQFAILKLHVLAAKFGIGRHHYKLPGFRLDVAEEAMEEILQGGNPSFITSKEPGLKSKRFSVVEAEPGLYFDLLLTVYGKARAFDVVKTLLEKYEKTMAKLGRDETFPFRFTYYAMDIHYREHDLEELTKYWELAKSRAVQTVKLSSQHKQDWLPPSSRTLLAQHLNLYLRALGGVGDYKRMLETIQDLFALGFDLDNSNWNWYIQLLLRSPEQLHTAFSLCERFLMPSWQRWHTHLGRRVKYYQQSGRHERGMEYMGPPGTFLASGQLHPRYKTVARFRQVLQDLSKEAQVNRQTRALLKSIYEVAPETVTAVKEMPMLIQPSAGPVRLEGYHLWWHRPKPLKKPKKPKDGKRRTRKDGEHRTREDGELRTGKDPVVAESIR